MLKKGAAVSVLRRGSVRPDSGERESLSASTCMTRARLTRRSR